MTTNLTIGADDWTTLGAVPASADFIFRLVNIDVSSGRLLSEDPWTVTTDAAGVATTLIPDAETGNGLYIRSTLRGFGSVTVASYPTGTITLVELLAYAVDPATLAPSTAPEAWWVALDAAVIGGGGGGGGDVASVNGKTGTVVLVPGDIAEAATRKWMTDVERTKLSGVATAATANATDAALRDRSTHTGTQSADTIVDGSTNHVFTTADDTKLAGIATGATVNQTDATTNAAIALKAPLASPALTGTPSAPTAANGTNTTQIATTAFVLANASGGGSVASVNSQTGTVVLTQDNIADGTTAKQYTATEKTKLSGVATAATANSADATLLARGNHTGTQSADTVVDGTTNKAYTAVEKTKLAGVASSATANASDASLRDRSTHTGTQTADTITDGTTNKAYTATEKTKLAGIATAATANQSDATTNAAIAAKVGSDGSVLNVIKLTQAAYDAIGTKVATTLYVIVG